MSPDAYIRVVFGLVAVLGFIGLIAFAARKFNLTAPGGRFAPRRRLSIVETLAIDARRKAVLLRCGTREHLVILGAQGETLIESAVAADAESDLQPRNPFTDFREAFAADANGVDADASAEDRKAA